MVQFCSDFSTAKAIKNQDHFPVCDQFRYSNMKPAIIIIKDYQSLGVHFFKSAKVYLLYKFMQLILDAEIGMFWFFHKVSAFSTVSVLTIRINSRSYLVHLIMHFFDATDVSLFIQKLKSNQSYPKNTIPRWRVVFMHSFSIQKYCWQD